MMGHASSPGAVTTSRGRLLLAPLAVGAAGVTALAALQLRDPHVGGSWGRCPFLLATGHPCPGCGALRAVHDLTQGDLTAAVHSNAAAVLALVIAAGLWLIWLTRRARGQRVRFIGFNLRAGMIIVVALVLFGAVRWTPWGAGLYVS